MIFRKGLLPVVEARLPDGSYAINVRYRTEIAVRPADFDLWHTAWQTVVFAIVGETLDPDEFIMGAELKDKRNKGSASVALRLDILFAKEDKDICDAICGELTRMLKERVPSLPFLFERRVPRSELGGGRGGGGRGGGGGGGGGGSSGGGEASYSA